MTTVVGYGEVKTPKIGISLVGKKLGEKKVPEKDMHSLLLPTKFLCWEEKMRSVLRERKKQRDDKGSTPKDKMRPLFMMSVCSAWRSDANENILLCVCAFECCGDAWRNVKKSDHFDPLSSYWTFTINAVDCAPQRDEPSIVLCVFWTNSRMISVCPKTKLHTAIETLMAVFVRVPYRHVHSGKVADLVLDVCTMLQVTAHVCECLILILRNLAT